MNRMDGTPLVGLELMPEVLTAGPVSYFNVEQARVKST